MSNIRKNIKQKYLAIDLGASSGRGIIGEFDGERLSLRENHRFVNAPVNVTGRLYWNILDLYSNIKQSIAKTVADGDGAVSLAIDTWGVDYGIVDKNGRLRSNPCHYRDSRTDGIFDYVESKAPLCEIYDATGIQSMNFNTIFQLAAELRDDPHAFDNGNRMLFIPDLLNYFLTGQAVTEYTIASTGAILDPSTRKYADRLLKKLNIPTDIFFGEPVMPGTRLGGLTESLISELGECKTQVVTCASHDTASAVLAVPAKDKDFIYISSGTWSLMGTELEKPLINEKTREYNYTNEGGADGSIRFLKNIMGLWIIQECRRHWASRGKEYSFAELTALAETVKPFVSIIDPDDPLFSPPGDMPARIAEYCRRTGQAVPESVGTTVRCVLDSLALCYRRTVENLCELTDKKASAINIVGGGTQNKLLCRLTADISGIPVIAGPIEATATGNILSQMIAAGEAKDIFEAREIVLRSFETESYEPRNIAGTEEAYERFLKLIEA